MTQPTGHPADYHTERQVRDERIRAIRQTVRTLNKDIHALMVNHANLQLELDVVENQTLSGFIPVLNVHVREEL